METRQKFRIGLIVTGVIFGLILLFSSWESVDMGEEGFLYRPYGDGVDTSKTYHEGTFMVAPWNDIITYNVRQQSSTYQSQVMDKNGTDIGVVVAVNFHVEKGNSAKLHLKHGEGYLESFIDKKVRGAIKDVIGRYTYVEVYSTKREALEDEIEHILEGDFDGNYVTLDFVEIADINLPQNIAQEITNKEQQKVKNDKSFLMKIEEKNLADAKIEKSRGDSALVVSAFYKAKAIEMEAKQLRQSPQYIELKKWEKWDGKGSPYGEGNVFGSGVQILKQN